MPNREVEITEGGYNPGEINTLGYWPKWETQACDMPLTLDIMPIGSLNPEDLESSKIGIASFVVMEQGHEFLEAVAAEIATNIVNGVNPKKALQMVTVESKGSFLAPYIKRALDQLATGRASERIIVFRKAEPEDGTSEQINKAPKVYMNRPVLIAGKEVWPPPVLTYNSITTAEDQGIVLGPRDIEYIEKLDSSRVEMVIVDDFLGTGGSAEAMVDLLEARLLWVQERFYLAVAGSDGDLWKEKLQAPGSRIHVLDPLPLVLPTFVRSDENQPWKIMS